MIKKNRKQIRLKNYDYSENGAYFITICCKDKESLFGKIVGDGILDVPFAERDNNGNVYVKLSNAGNTVQQSIEYINEHNENIDIEKYLDDIELVVVGGESDRNARPLNYDWVLNIREQCVRQNTDFEFRQCGTYTIKDGRQYKIQTKNLCRQAKAANIDF